MNITTLSIIEASLLIVGAVLATRLTRWLSKNGDRKVVLMASVASWFILFGMVPFLVFSLFVASARGTAALHGIGTLATFVLNVIPFALVASPLIGSITGFVLSRHMQRV
ncbi:MAG: hypothetical protein ABR507_01805 [Actinomycetota bacterium]|nr:hypothetical protein [Actinomycetota bacterium]